MSQREAFFRERDHLQQHIHQAPAKERDDDVLDGVLRRVAIQHRVAQRREEDQRVEDCGRGDSQQEREVHAVAAGDWRL